jgi:hypothetical protein
MSCWMKIAELKSLIAKHKVSTAVWVYQNKFHCYSIWNSFLCVLCVCVCVCVCVTGLCRKSRFNAEIQRSVNKGGRSETNKVVFFFVVTNFKILSVAHISRFDLLANICHDSPAERENVNADPLQEGSYKVHLQNKVRRGDAKSFQHTHFKTLFDRQLSSGTKSRIYLLKILYLR